MANFCTNCGTRVEKNYKFCINCGTRIDNSDIRENKPPSKSVPDGPEVKKAKKELKRVIGGRFSYNQNFIKALADSGMDDVHTRLAIRRQVNDEIESGQITSAGVEVRVYQVMAEYKIRMEKEKEEEAKRLKLIDEILDSDDVITQIMKSKNSQTFVSAIKDSLKEKLINEKEIKSEYEIRQFINGELEKLKEEEEKKARIEAMQRVIPPESNINRSRTETDGGYCDYSCIHYSEEFIDSDGEISYDFTGSEIIDHYCNLGHNVAYGSFCRHYEKYLR